jgi:hypothetical protein
MRANKHTCQKQDVLQYGIKFPIYPESRKNMSDKMLFRLIFYQEQQVIALARP